MPFTSLKYQLVSKIRGILLALVLTVLSCSMVIECQAQMTDGTLGVHHYEEHFTHHQLFKLLTASRQDTARVGILLKISSIYWRKGEPSDLDSCTYFAKQALTLSHQFHFVKGANEALFLECKSFTAKSDLRSAQALLPLVYGEMKVRLLLVISEYYVFLPEQLPVNLDTAYIFMIKARSLSNSLQSVYWNRYCHLLFGKYYFERGEYDNGKREMLQIIAGYKKLRDTAWEAYYWSELGLYLPRAKNAYKDKRYSHEMAIRLFLSIHKTGDAIYSLRDLSELNLDYQHTDLAEKQMTRVLNMLDSMKIKRTFFTNLLAAQILVANGKFAEGLPYLLAALKIVNPEDRYQQMFAYSMLADIYYAQGLYAKSLSYNRIVLDYCISEKRFSTYTYCHKIVLNDIKLDNAKSALLFLTEFSKKHPPVYLNDRELMALSFGNIYNALKLYNKAEASFLQMIRFNVALKAEPSHELEHLADNDRMSSSEANSTIGHFYVQRKQYEKARPYLVQALDNNDNNSDVFNIAGRGSIHFQLYKIDSAAKNFTSALKHYNTYHYLKDSIFSATRDKQFLELQMAFETKQKEQSIKLLTSKSKQQLTELKTLNSERRLIFAGICMLMVIAILAVMGYRSKQSSNRQLRTKQDEINLQNYALQGLISDKDGLLWEKELLLTELQHRVKNNLQVVIGLLNKQSAFIHSKTALSAIQESKNRIQAMALIHQKFYSTPIIGSVNMKQYVYELVNYLEFSFGVKQHKIKIAQKIDVQTLDISQLLPIGLILNEAITNSIKHAFEPDQEGGKIQVNLIQLGEGLIKLTIADNGKGLPADFAVERGRSLGTEILIDLSKQLGAELNIKSDNGVIISVKFKESSRTKEKLNHYL